MRRIQTGKGSISLLTLLAIWSISLVVDLPGLAISPVLSVIDKIFPHVSHLESQMLEILPNFFIFPFILLSGKMAKSQNKVGFVATGLAIFLAAGIAYFFVNSIWGLIIVSCVLGIGCGIVIPLAAGLLADMFTGKYRLQQMGIKSGIANLTLVAATVAVGFMEGRDWHLPFLVYLIPVIPLVMSVFLTKRFAGADAPDNQSAAPAQAQTAPQQPLKQQPHVVRKLWGVIIFYFVVTVAGITISSFMPFLMASHHMGDEATGYVSSTFYLALTIPGFMLGRIVRTFGKATMVVCCVMMVAGALLIALCPALWAYFIGAFLMGFGNGVLQPIFYDKASELSPSPEHSTRMLSYVMSANYLGIAVCPLFFAGMNSDTAFLLSAACMAVMLLVTLIARKSFAFRVTDELAAYSTDKAR